MLLVRSIVLEDVQAVFHTDIAVQVELMRDLIFFLDEIELLADGRIVFVFVLPDLKQDLYHVLCALVDIGLVQDAAKLVKDGQGNRLLHLFQKLADFARQADSNLDGIIGGLVEKQKQDLRDHAAVRDLLVTEVGDKRGRGQTDGLVISPKRLAELHDESVQQQFPHLRELRVDDGRHGGVDGGERERRRLGLHDASAEQAAAADQILAKELGNDVLDVGDVDLVDEAVDGFLERLPRHALVLFACLVGDLRLQGAQSCGWDVCAARTHVQQLLVFRFGRRLLLILGHWLARGIVLLAGTKAFLQHPLPLVGRPARGQVC